MLDVFKYQGLDLHPYVDSHNVQHPYHIGFVSDYYPITISSPNDANKKSNMAHGSVAYHLAFHVHPLAVDPW